MTSARAEHLAELHEGAAHPGREPVDRATGPPVRALPRSLRRAEPREVAPHHERQVADDRRQHGHARTDEAVGTVVSQRHRRPADLDIMSRVTSPLIILGCGYIGSRLARTALAAGRP
ncbi:MAG: hypothetical protein K8M05_14105, partial [Deltaproteobacteria bacterium]|nr:hypothetical protein [Kofleriaceae bacterium]